MSEPAKGIAIDIGCLVYFLGHAAHEALQDPHRQRHVEQAMRQCDGDMGVKEAHAGIKLEEGQGKDGRRRHAVREQPEKQVVRAQKVEPRERIRRR